MPWSDDLDPELIAYQIAASENQFVRVVAGPGTGKSFAMKRRVARLLETGIDAETLLAVTFTRVAADDLHRELTQLAVPGSQNLRGRTLHSLALSILSRNHVMETVGRVPRPMNRFEERALICDLAKDFGGKNPAKKLLAAYLAAWAEAQGDEPGYEAGTVEHAFSAAVVSWLEFHRGMLIGEAIPYLLHYLHNHPAAEERTEFTHILVDEYQDLNQAEQLIIEYLSDDASVSIVGDDDQSIYSFKHAHPQGIQEWPEEHSGCGDFGLEDCYRCPTDIVDIANSLIAHNQNRGDQVLEALPQNGPGEIETRQFLTIDDEANWIAEEVVELLEEPATDLGDIIVLTQRSVIANVILGELKDRGIPSRSYYDESQLESEAAQEPFALLKLLADTTSRAPLRFLLGVGHPDLRASQYSRIRENCEESGNAPWDVLTQLANGQLRIRYTTQIVERFTQIAGRLDQLQGLTENLSELVDALFPEGEEELEDIRSLALEAIAEEADLNSLVKKMIEAITQPEIPPSINEVRVMSLHKSKGLSSPIVFVAGCVQGLLPKMPEAGLPSETRVGAIEEQRRLFYVAITRAKSDLPNNQPGRLYLSYSMQMPTALALRAAIQPTSFAGNTVNLQASMFLNELGPSAPAPIAGD